MANLAWRRTTLSNGLTVLKFPKPSDNTAQMSVVVKYGSNNETQKTVGTAHFIEHMLAGGSTERINLSRSIEGDGGVIDFYTDHEYTMSMADVLPENLAKASDILYALLLGKFPFEKEKFAAEAQIILNELAEMSDDPAQKVNELFLNCLYRDHPLKWPVGGYPKNIRSLTIEQLEKTYQQQYTPQNALLIFTGNVSDSDIEKATRTFEAERNTMPNIAHPKRNHSETESKKPATEVRRKKAGISQTYLSVGAKTVPSKNPGAPTLDLLSILMGNGASSRLFISLREENALTYDISSVHSKGLDFGYFSVDCAIKNKNVVKAKTLILKEFEKLRSQMISDEELIKAKNMMLGGILREIDDPEQCHDIITFMEMQFQKETALADYCEKIKSVSARDILDAANRYFKEDAFSTAILAPKNE